MKNLIIAIFSLLLLGACSGYDSSNVNFGNVDSASTGLACDPGTTLVEGVCLPDSVTCSGNQIYTDSTQTACATCTAIKVPSADRMSCEYCPEHLVPSADGSVCVNPEVDTVTCDPNEIYTSAAMIACTQCTGNTIPSADKMSCTACASGKESSADGSTCVDASDYEWFRRAPKFASRSECIVEEANYLSDFVAGCESKGKTYLGCYYGSGLYLEGSDYEIPAEAGPVPGSASYMNFLCGPAQ